MNQYSKDYLSGLSQLEMVNADDSSVGLIHVDEINSSEINYYQRISLEKAKKVGANAVYFRNFTNPSRSPKPQIYIFDFTESQQNIVEIHKNVWSSSEVRLYIVISKSEIKLFNSSKPVSLDSNGELKVSPFDTLKIAGEAIDNYKKYSAKKFDNGTFWEDTKQDFGYGETAYEKLIKELKNARNYFLETIKLDKPIASKLLVLSILIKYLEERVDVDENGNQSRVFTKEFFHRDEFGNAVDFIDIIKKGNVYLLNLFTYLSRHFNGEIFYLSEEYRDEIEKIDLDPLANFLSGMLDNNQFVLWKLFSFNHLPIELISSIYEMFLEADKDSGIAYTPSYLVNFMIDECMPIHHPKKDFKILDPACGSGIFLVSAYKRIIDWWRVGVYEETNKWIHPNKEHLPKLKSLLKSSIFGIDIEGEAVDLAIFSLSLTLCDILSPKVIWENLKFDDLGNNILESDFFKWYPNNNTEKFDLLIGNPPFIEYGSRETTINSLLANIELEKEVPNNQSALLFTVYGMSLVNKESGLLSFVLPSGPLLYNNSRKPIEFRRWLLGKYNTPQIIDFTYLSNTLFKNKGNEKNVAVSTFFLENKPPDNEPIHHITVKKLKSAKERQYFEIDHYDFHKVDINDAINNPFVWKANLLGGGRLFNLINTLNSFSRLGDYLKFKKENNGWFFGEGFIIGNRKNYDHESVVREKPTLPTSSFTEEGINIVLSYEQDYFEATRTKEIFSPPLLLIKERIGKKTIPIDISEEYLTYRHDIIGIHCPETEIDDLRKLKSRIFNNQLYRFFLITTSGRAGISRSTFTVLKQDIMNLPYPENEKDISLTDFDNILIHDTLNHGLEFLGKEKQVKCLQTATQAQMKSFGSIFCQVLNSLFEIEQKKYYMEGCLQTESFTCAIFNFGETESDNYFFAKNSEGLEDDIAKLVHNNLGSSYRINRVLKVYDRDYIYLLKPKELRYWLKSVALRDADETILDLYKAGY